MISTKNTIKSKKNYDNYISDSEIMNLYTHNEQEGYEKIIDKYSKYIYHIIHAYFPSYHKYTEELYQQGAIGLMNAMKSYDPRKGAFTTHCTPYVKKELSKQIMHISGEPSAYYASIHNAVTRAKSKIEARGDEATIDNIMQETNLSRKIVERELNVDHVKVSYDTLTNISSNMELSDNFIVEDMLSVLPEDMRDIVRMKAVEGLSFKTIANELGRTLFNVRKDYFAGIDILKNSIVS